MGFVCVLGGEGGGIGWMDFGSCVDNAHRKTDRPTDRCVPPYHQPTYIQCMGARLGTEALAALNVASIVPNARRRLVRPSVCMNERMHA